MGCVMLHITKTIIVEGTYDRIRVNEVCDAFCLTTGGFDIFTDKEKQGFIRRLAKENGVIVLTDSDRAGFAIRSLIKSVAAGGEVLHAYIPEVFGKERRKDKPSAEGKLGVEGIEREALEKVLRPFAEDAPEQREKITKQDFFELGLTGAPDSAARREALCAALGVPRKISAKALVEALNTVMTKKQLYEMVNSGKFDRD